MYNIKELALENKYIRNAVEIKEIALKENCDVGIALDMYCRKHGIKYFPYDEKQHEFLDVCRAMTLTEVIKELNE